MIRDIAHGPITPDRQGGAATLTARILRPEHVGGEESTTWCGKVRAAEEN
jgi:hypothetical protein